MTGVEPIWRAIIPLVSTLIGGLITIVTTVLVLRRQNQDSLARMRIENRIRQEGEFVGELKRFYVEVSHYFISLCNTYNTFRLVISGELKYDEWYKLELATKEYEYAWIEIMAHEDGSQEGLEEIMTKREEINEICFFDIGKYKKGMDFEINGDRFKILFKEFVDLCEGNERTLMASIIERKERAVIGSGERGVSTRRDGTAL